MKYWRKPLDLESIKASRGKVIIVEDRCKGCEFCVAYCPRDVLGMSQTFNVKGYHTPAVIDASKCVNCHFCEALCPEFAIYSIEETEAAKHKIASSRRKNKSRKELS